MRIDLCYEIPVIEIHRGGTSLWIPEGVNVFDYLHEHREEILRKIGEADDLALDYTLDLEYAVKSKRCRLDPVEKDLLEWDGIGNPVPPQEDKSCKSGK